MDFRSSHCAGWPAQLESCLRALMIACLICSLVESSTTFGQTLGNSGSEVAIDQVLPSLVRFETIGGLTRVNGNVVNAGPSTGVVVSEDGYVLSAAINFVHQPTAIFARLADGQRVSAELVGNDKSRHLVLLKVNSPRRLPVPRFVSRKEIQVGQTAIALGRVYDSVEPNISIGIISATNRIWGKAIQTDAKVSAANYGGPLVDQRGRVAGILAPMSPNDEGIFGGSDWYDSGIGFAVPLDEMILRIESLKNRDSIRAGVLGVVLKGTNIYSDPAIISYCPASSPAWKSGLRPGDNIVKVNRQVIQKQSDLKHALGPLYEFDRVKLVAERDGKLLKFEIELAGELEPFQPAAIGFLPDMSRPDSDGLRVRHVLPELLSAGLLQPGDEFVSIDENPVRTWRSLRRTIAMLIPGEQVSLRVRRAEKVQEVRLEIRRQSSSPAIELPPLLKEPPVEQEWKTEPIRLSDSTNSCFSYSPDQQIDDAPLGLVVWIPEPGVVDPAKFLNDWRTACEQRNIALLVPQSLQKNRWQKEEAEFVLKSIAAFAKQRRIDNSRIVVGGNRAGGVMAGLLASDRLDLFRGLVLVDCGLSSRIRPIRLTPNEPMLVLVNASETFRSRRDYTRLIQSLGDWKLPFYVDPDPDSDPTRLAPKIIEWADAVNRL